MNTGGAVPPGTYCYVSTFAGTHHTGFTNGTLTSASFNQPRDVTVDNSGNTYIVDDNNVIRKVSPAGIVTVFAGSGALGSANGTGTSATFRYMLGIITDANGNVYVTDSNNNMIRKITPAGVVTTLAGTGSIGATNGPGATASFHSPFGIAIDALGNLYVADMFNNMIRKITPAGVVTKIAGAANGSYYNYGDVDGIGLAAQFSFPYGLGTDGSNVYVADNQNSDIRKLSLTGYTISPGLPAGLVFDTTTGIISGTPTILSPPTDYTVTAYNGSGSSTTIVNIAVTNSLQQNITFLQLPVKTYGDADFNASATSTNSTLPLLYMSSNTSVATITAIGEIHITGAGSCIITVSQGGNTIYDSANPVSQTLIVNPAALVIVANDQTRLYGQPNPTLTFSGRGFVNGETFTNLIAQPVTLTTANSSSPPGIYTISVGQAQSINYDINYISGTLTISKASLAITIPNTFTPNNDGINDTWKIAGIENDTTILIDIFNRYGLLVYHSNGYYKPWDGYYDGKRLPTGTYFYIISTKNNDQKLSGSITIIY